MGKKNTHSNKDFHSSNGRATRIGIAPLFYYGEDGTIFKIIKCKNNPLFHKYKQFAKPDHEAMRNFDENLENLRKIYYQAIETRWLWSELKAIILEGEWTDNPKGLVHISSLTVTRSISYRLEERDEDVDAVEHQK